MKFYSTNNSNHLVSLQDAVINGLAPDNGLYMPEKIPVFKAEYFLGKLLSHQSLFNLYDQKTFYETKKG